MAIDFPAAPSLNDTFVAGGITWSWDGTSWKTAIVGGGGGTSYDDTNARASVSASNNAPAGGGSIAYNNSTGEFTFTPPDLSGYANVNAFTATKAGSSSGNGNLTYNNAGTFVYTPPDLSGYLTSENDTLASVTSRGSVTTSNVTVNDLEVSGNLTVQGSTTQLGTYTVSADEIVILDGTSGAPTQDAFLRIDRGTSTDVSLKWNETSDNWQFTNDGTNYLNLNQYSIGGSNNTSNQAILSLTGTDTSASTVEFGGSGGTTVSWDGPSSKVTITSTAPVNADWNATTGLAQILNKPTIPPAYTLPIATAADLGGIKVGANLTINPSTGVLDANPGSYTLPAATTTTLGGIKIGSGLTIDGNGVVDVNVGGGNTLASRQPLQATTASIADDARVDLNITGYKTYALLSIATTAAAWVRVYTTAEARTADVNRSEGNDPGPGSGVIAEVRTTGAETVNVSPGVLGYNGNAIPTTATYLSVTNRSGSSVAITVTLTAVKLEV